MTEPSHRYPNAERLQERLHEYRTIREFLEWAGGAGYRLAVTQEPAPGSVAYTFPVSYNDIEHIIHQFLEIDINKLDQEREAMLQWLRNMNTA